MSCGDLFLALIAVVFPPLPVWVKTGLCSAQSCLNILLCILGFIPGLIHSWYIIASYPEHDYEHIHDPERQERVTYYVISHQESQGRHGGRHTSSHGYGTVPKNSSHNGAHHHDHHSHHQQFIYAPPQQAPPQFQSTGTVRNESAPSSSRPAPSSSSNNEGAPPSYNEAVRGGHKIQN